MSLGITEESRAAAPGQTGLQVRTTPLHLALHALLMIVSVTALIPMLWMLSTSLKTSGTELEWPIQWIPTPIVWSNYIHAHTMLAFGYYYRNTITITVLSTLGSVITSSMAGYAFGRLRFIGRTVLFGLVLATMMLPNIVTLIPTYLIWRYLGWLDTLVPLIVPSWLGGSAFYIFLMRQFMLGLPRELDEAARMDGASTYRIFWQVVLPLCGPALAAIAIFSFVAHWTDFLAPLIYLNSDHNRTVAIGLALGVGAYHTSYNYVMAISFTMTLPIVALFFFAQRYFMRGVVLSGLAGR